MTRCNTILEKFKNFSFFEEIWVTKNKNIKNLTKNPKKFPLFNSLI